MNYVAEAEDLVRNLRNRMGPSAYDIAWLARLRDPSTGDARWPDLVVWLLEHQQPDGSWGGEIPYYHDRIISTLSACIALQQNGRSRSSEEAIARAEKFLWRNLHLLARDPFELVGFELIFPTLLAEAQQLGLDVPTHTCGYGRIQTTKLRLIPPEMLYSPHVSTILSIEFLGRSGQVGKLREALTEIGSLGNSPAATAYYLSLIGDDDQALEYLESVRSHMPHIIPVFPFRTFELTWVLNNLAAANLSIRHMISEDAWRTLQHELNRHSVGFDPTFEVPDGDTTSVCCRVLLAAGYNVDPQILQQYEDRQKQVFRTYFYERNPSVSTNVHALEALSLMKDYPNRAEVQDQIITMLLDSRKYNTFWIDKWHASPYYATAHTLTALLNAREYLAPVCQHTVDWIEHTQRDDGSWGYFEHGTIEETAFAMSALLHFNRRRPVDAETLHRGAAYLAREHRGPASTYPQLWIVKSLYAPYDIVRSSILGALIMYEQTFGRTP
ncbi:MAG: hypothetical protein GX620_01505 [Chloroflexi bacterium]|nr:hypothetical protein [Chloroflexota bacterium]